MRPEHKGEPQWQASDPIRHLTTSQSPVFLVNSRYPRFTATPEGSWREASHPQGHTFSRSYGVNLLSSLTRVLSSALGCSPHPPVSVSGTVSTAVSSCEAFPGSLESPSSRTSRVLPHHISALKTRLWPSPPTLSAYLLELPSNRQLGYPPPSLLKKPSVLVQEFSPASHRLRVSASS